MLFGKLVTLPNAFAQSHHSVPEKVPEKTEPSLTQGISDIRKLQTKSVGSKSRSLEEQENTETDT